MPFDADSGLVFSEAIVKKPAHPNDTSLRCIGRPPVRSSIGNGSDSLVSVTLRKLLCSLDKLDANSLSTVPEGLLKKIWGAIQRS